MYGLYRNGRLLKKTRTEAGALDELHRISPASWSHALKYEGYSIKKMLNKRK